MLTLREPAPRPLLCAIARVLILALVAGLLPADARAWVPATQAPGRVAVPVGNPSGLTESAFGELLSHTGSDPQPYAFTGEPLDPNSGWQYHRARWLDPRAGRFVGMDPLLANQDQNETDDPGLVALRPYSYTHADPVNYLDPGGEYEFTIAGISVTLSMNSTIRSTSSVQVSAVRHTAMRQLGQMGGQSVRALRSLRTVGQQTHHVLEKRLYNQLARYFPRIKQVWRHHDAIPGVNVSPAQHQAFTNAWRAAFPYRNQAGHIVKPTLEQIMAVAEKIYTNYPQLLKALQVELLLL